MNNVYSGKLKISVISAPIFMFSVIASDILTPMQQILLEISYKQFATGMYLEEILYSSEGL